jgi:hypothetical protein
MPKNSSQLAENLTKKIRSIEATRLKLERLCSEGLLSNRAATQMYEGMFLNAHVAFEGFIEELFVGLLVDGQGISSSRSDVMPRIVVRSYAVAREILFPSNRPYIDWFPYERTLELAYKYFRGGRPFSDLTDPDKQHLLKCHSIRNVVAHNSKDSRTKFEKRVLGNTPLPPHERNPAGFLRGLYRIAPIQTRYENIVTELLIIAKKLAA